MTNGPRPDKQGFYYVKGRKYPQLKGSRVQVFNGTAYKTTGGLVKSDIFRRQYRTGKVRYLSKKKHRSSKRENRLQKFGWGAKRGKFGAVRLTQKA